MAIELKKVEDAQELVQSSIQSAMKAPSWMIAVWTVKDGKLQLVNRTTWEFPTADFPAAVDQLNSLCQKEMAAGAPALPIEPLPLAMLEDAGFDNTEDPYL